MQKEALADSIYHKILGTVRQSTLAQSNRAILTYCRRIISALIENPKNRLEETHLRYRTEADHRSFAMAMNMLRGRHGILIDTDLHTVAIDPNIVELLQRGQR